MRPPLVACALAALTALALALGACEAHRDGTSATSRDSAASAGSGTAAAADSGSWLAAKAYLDGWHATGASLEHASGVSDTTRDADVASAFVLGKATEQHLFEAFASAAAATGAPRDTSIERKLRALHAARMKTLDHYQAFLSDGTAEELELAKEGWAAEVAIATPLGEELKAKRPRGVP